MKNFGRVKSGRLTYRHSPYSVSAYVGCCHIGMWALDGQTFHFFKRNQKSRFCMTSPNFNIMEVNPNILSSMQAKKNIAMGQIWPMNHCFKVLRKSYLE